MPAESSFERTFRVFRAENGPWGIEVKEPGSITWTVSGFRDRSAAQEWIEREKLKCAGMRGD